jgi:site-specific recombinase XerD
VIVTVANNELVTKFRETDKAHFILESYIYAFKKYIEDKGKLSHATITEMISELHCFDKYLMLAYPQLEDVKAISKLHISFYCKFCLDELKVKKKTVNKKLRAIRKFYDYLANIRHIVEFNIALSEPYVKIDTEANPISMPKGVLTAIFASLEFKKHGIRDSLISKFLSYTGLQLKEVLALRIDNISMDSRKVVIKRKKADYEFIMPDELFKSMKQYLTLRNNELLQSSTNYLFLSNTGSVYTARSYQYAFKNALISSNILGNYTPRNLKSTFCYNMAKVTPQDELKKILNQNKVEHYYVDSLSANPLLPNNN